MVIPSQTGCFARPCTTAWSGTIVALPLGVFDRTTTSKISTGIRVRARGDAWTVAGRQMHTDCESVKLTGTGSANRGIERTLLHPFDRIERISGRPHPRTLHGRSWSRSILGRLSRVRPFGSLAAAADADVRLLPFQLEPALAILRHGHTRVLIADEVGLGKTIQASLVLAELAALSDAFRAIVLAPASLLDQWTGELSARVRLAAKRADTRWLVGEVRQLPPDVNPWSLPGVYVASLDLAKRPEVLHALEKVSWDIAVVDEAHTLGTGTARLVAANAVARCSRRVITLTATPPDGDPRQSAALTRVGDTGEGLVVFRRTREDIGLASRRRSTLLAVRLAAPERRMHRLVDRYTRSLWKCRSPLDSRPALVATLLQKRALSSASSLLRSVERRLSLLTGVEAAVERQLDLPLGDEDPLDDQATDTILSAPGLDNREKEQRALRRIVHAASAAARGESKIRALLRYLRRASEPALVFTEYRDTLMHLDAVLRAAGHDAVLLHGGMPERARAESVRVFNQAGAIMLATDAASEGLNLHTHCRLVVHFELPWTPSRLEQRAGRVDRLGQSHTVHEVMLVARDTAERLVLGPLVRRLHRARGSRSPLSNRLRTANELVVAAAVIGGEPLATGEPSAAETPALFRLEVEGCDEAVRLARERHYGRWLTTPSREILIDPGGRSATETEATILFEVQVFDGAGNCIHAEVAPIRVFLLGAACPRGRHVRGFVKLLTRTGTPELLAAVRRSVAAQLAKAQRQAAAVASALHRRDAAFSHERSSARLLVQAGLFDGRAVRQMERDRNASALLLENVAARAAETSRAYETGVRMIGIRVGSTTG